MMGEHVGGVALSEGLEFFCQRASERAEATLGLGADIGWNAVTIENSKLSGFPRSGWVQAPSVGLE